MTRIFRGMYHPFAMPALSNSGLVQDLETAGALKPGAVAFPLLMSAEGRAALRRQAKPALELARACRTGLILLTATEGAARDRGAALGHDAAVLDRVNRLAVTFLRKMAAEEAFPARKYSVAGCIAPRETGAMTVREAASWHARQVTSLTEGGADLVFGNAFQQVEEAAGFVMAARARSIPCSLSFAIDAAGRLADGTPLATAILAVDALTTAYPAFYTLSCTRPASIAAIVAQEPLLAARLCGFHVAGDGTTPARELAEEAEHLAWHLPGLAVLGGTGATAPALAARLVAAPRIAA